jgi:hypothetical protein
MKKWYTSKTVLLKIAGGVVVVLQYFGTINIIPAETLSGLLVVANFALRFLTHSAIARVIK